MVAGGTDEGDQDGSPLTERLVEAELDALEIHQAEVRSGVRCGDAGRLLQCLEPQEHRAVPLQERAKRQTHHDEGGCQQADPAQHCGLTR